MEVCKEDSQQHFDANMGSSDDSTSNCSKKHKRYTTNRNQTQNRQCIHQTQFPFLLYNHLLSHVVLSALVAGLYTMIHYQVVV